MGFARRTIRDNMKNILITGGNGMLGSHIDFGLKPSSKELNLKNYEQLTEYIQNNNITDIIHAAAKVGGVNANNLYSYDFLIDNLQINLNIIKTIKEYNIKNAILFLSTCVFPSTDNENIEEKDLHLGDTHPTNIGYGHAKRFLEVAGRCLNQQYHISTKCIVPCNMYGLNDNYSLDNSHVIPGLIHKCYLAKETNTDLVVWGSGLAEREFMFAGDMAKLLKSIFYEKIDLPSLMIVSPNYTNSIIEIVELIVKYMGFKGNIIFDKNKPEGTRKRTSNSMLFNNIFPNFKFTALEEGLSITIEDFTKNYHRLRK